MSSDLGWMTKTGSVFILASSTNMDCPICLRNRVADRALMMRIMRKMTRLPRSFVSGLAAPALALLMSTAAPVAAFAQDAAPAAPAATAPAPDAAPSSAPAPAATPDAAPAPAAPEAPAPAASAPAEQAPPAAADTKEEANPYGLGALWSNGDIIARGVLLIMLTMSLGLSLIHI